MRSTRLLSALLAVFLLAAPAAALAKKDDPSTSAAKYEEKLIQEGKAKGGKMLAPAPEPGPSGPVSPPPPGPGGAVTAPAPPPATLDGSGVIVAVVLAALGLLGFADARRLSA
jgi:hypothetical protein